MTEENSHYFGPDPQNKKQQCYQFRNSSANIDNSSVTVVLAMLSVP